MAQGPSAGAAVPVAASTDAVSPFVTKAPSDIPAGIRMGLVRLLPAAGAAGGGRQRIVNTVAFADKDGRPLYSPTAECAADCLKKWSPALAAPKAKPAGDFSLVSGPSGAQQWAFRGKPLYTEIGGASISDPLVLPEWDLLRPPGALGLEVKASADGMKLAAVEPAGWTKTPFSMGIAEYRLAPGQVLAVGVAGNNPMGKPVYAFSGSPAQEKALPKMFRPVYAAALSLPVGDFSVRTRTDGSPQWAFRGASLYTCICDISAGDLNGEGAAPGIAPATLVRYFVPPEVVVKKDVLSIGRMAEAKTGKTLYFRDRLEDDYVPDNARPLLGTLDPKVGAQLGLKHCDVQCEKEWRPVLAPKDAQPQGYWSIYDRPDGTRQWGYKNYAVYTHATEAPGALDGNENYMVQLEDGHGNEALPKEFGLGLSWRALVP